VCGEALTIQLTSCVWKTLERYAETKPDRGAIWRPHNQYLGRNQHRAYMSTGFDNFDRLGNSIRIPIPADEDGYTGRECPNRTCLGYFKIKIGTGLKGEGLPCVCPYCGHTASHNKFWTKEQIEYAQSVAMRDIDDALRADLESMEFEMKPRGPFGIGISMKLQPSNPLPIHYYREKKLETSITCDSCTLEYSVYGLFAFCPDCGVHNSLQILVNNLRLVRKQLSLASTVEDPELTRHLIEDALENCVSSFDGFARESCRVRASKGLDSAQAQTLSFQNLPKAAERLKTLFGIDFRSAVDNQDWDLAHTAFMKRHVLAHRAGVVDQQYQNETSDPDAHIGRRVIVSVEEVQLLTQTIERIGRVLLSLLPSVK
jgi:hypothetical protein